jgi:hypothetical protein
MQQTTDFVGVIRSCQSWTPRVQTHIETLQIVVAPRYASCVQPATESAICSQAVDTEQRPERAEGDKRWSCGVRPTRVLLVGERRVGFYQCSVTVMAATSAFRRSPM